MQNNIVKKTINTDDKLTETLLHTSFDQFVNESFDKNRRVFTADLDDNGKVHNREVKKMPKDTSKDFTYRVKKPSTKSENNTTI